MLDGSISDGQNLDALCHMSEDEIASLEEGRFSEGGLGEKKGAW